MAKSINSNRRVSSSSYKKSKYSQNKKPDNRKSDKKSGYLRILVILAIILFVLFISISVFVNKLSEKVLEVHQLNASLKVGDYVGLNVDTDKIYFGTVFPGGGSRREVFLTTNVTGIVYITTDTSALNWMFVSGQYLKIKSGETLILTFYSKPAQTMPFGAYEVPVYIYVLKSEPSLLQRICLRGKPVQSESMIVRNPEISINITAPAANQTQAS